MIYIQKRRIPPTIKRNLVAESHKVEWKKISDDNTKAMRDFFDGLDFKPQIRESLAKQQCHICAYCMKKIDYLDSQRVKIEHFIPLSQNKNLVLNYNNYLLVCDGGAKSKIHENKKRILCCDSSRGEKELVLNPMDHLQMEHIRYRRDGKIYYSDKSNIEFENGRNNDINNLLCLNGKLNKDGSIQFDTSTGIVKGRRDAYHSTINFIQAMEKKYSRNSRKMKEIITDKIDKLKSSDDYEEFIGVKLFVLKRKLKQLS